MKQREKSGHGCCCSGGFTLFEVLVTLAVIAIVIGFAAPTLRTLAPGMKLKGAAREVYSGLQNARQTAIKENRMVTVNFDQAGRYYLDTGEQFPFEPEIQYGTGNAANDWTGAAPTLAGAISFSTRGLPTITPAGASVFLQYVDGAGNAMNSCYAIEVTTAGSIRLHRWNGNQWD